MLLKSTIETEEGGYMEIIGIPNTLIQTIIEHEEDKVILLIRGNLSELIMISSIDI